MNLLHMRWTIIVIIALSFLACGKKEKILIDGSSTVYPITEAVAEEYRKVAPNVNVTVGISGTGGGFKKFCHAEIDISDASRHIKASEIEECKKNGVNYLELPVAYDGLAVLVNPENDFVKAMSVAELKSIFESGSKVKSWKDVNAAYPDLPLKIFSPGQDSGTFDYFVEAILGKDARVRADASFSEDDNVLVTGISGEKGGIGFFGIAYYEENKDRLKLVPVVNPATGAAVLPSEVTVKDGSYAPLSRPVFIYVNQKAKARPEVDAFVKFYLDNVGKLAGDTGYFPLESERYADLKQKFVNFQ
ncbi:MAG: PstS family phosphate ABC transporter substrate-binding protein [Spirochaetales bacterium]|nr:PstS family phosphate ABC transporter substrate-binding protein [Spirochaetales bacterium]